MRIFLLLGLAVAAVAVTVRGGVRGQVPVISLALLATIAVPSAWLEHRWEHTLAYGTLAVQLVSGRPDAYLGCQRLGGASTFAGAELGHVEFDAAGHASPEAWLTMQTCQHLRDWLYSDKSHPTLDQVIAVHVLTHESVHVSGQPNEAITECTAMQKDALVAQLLGATPAQARALAAEYVAKVYPNMPSNYTSTDCAPNGPLDLSPGDGVWP